MEKEYQAKEFWNTRYLKFDATSSGHINLPLQYNNWLYRLKRKKVEKLVRKFSVSNDYKNLSFAELGCGTGVYIKQWEKMGIKNLIGIDISSAAILKLKDLFPDYQFNESHLASKDILDICGKESRDIVTVIGVLVHIVDDDEFSKSIQNIAELLNENGSVIVSDYICRGVSQDRQYMKIRNIDWFINEFKKAGLTLKHQRAMYFVMGRPYDCQTWVSQKIMNAIYKLNRKLMVRLPNLTGLFLYVIDRAVTPFLKDGPSEEVFVFTKVSA